MRAPSGSNWKNATLLIPSERQSCFLKSPETSLACAPVFRSTIHNVLI
jgi:hypothetical protein